MTLYRCTKRLKTVDGVIHEVGSIVDLTGVDESGAVAQDAVVLATQPTQPTLPKLQQERAQIDQQIATMEHEGGA